MTEDQTCRNCGTRLQLRYCPACGQDRREPRTGLRPLLGLLWTHLTGAEGIAIRTLGVLLLHPGRLTRAWIDGQRVRYASPVRLYLWCTAGFFLLHAYAPFVQLDPATGEVHSSLTTLSIETSLGSSTRSRISSKGLSLASFAPRFDAAVSAYLPALLIVLVLATAALTRGLFWREPVMTHAVFALHWSAFYFLLAAIRRLLMSLGDWGVVGSALGVPVALVYLAVAMKVTYDRTWFGSIVRAITSFALFAGLLVAWLWSTTALAALVSSWEAG